MINRITGRILYNVLSSLILRSHRKIIYTKELRTFIKCGFSRCLHVNNVQWLVLIQGEKRRPPRKGCTHSAFASRTFIPAGRVSYGLQLISCQVVHGGQRAYPRSFASPVSLVTTWTTNPSGLLNNQVHYGYIVYVVYVQYVVFLVLISIQHSKKETVWLHRIQRSHTVSLV